MSDAPDPAAGVRRLDALYRAKAKAEIASAESACGGTAGVRGQGDVLAEVLLVKGEPGPADRARKRALSGDDGVAIGKALDALCLPKARYALCTACEGPREARLARLRLLAEAIDPAIVVLLDPVAARDFTDAYGAPPLRPGTLATICGRTVAATDDFEASLADEHAKRTVWSQLQVLSSAPGRETGAP